jgi:membrane dipeptidase
MTRHPEYAVDLVGIDHVSISSDSSFDAADFIDELTRNPEMFDDSDTRWGPIQWMTPETLLTLGVHLERRGWSGNDIRAVLGGNFFRVAQQAWRQ